MGCTCRQEFERKGRDRFAEEHGDRVEGEIESEMQSHVFLFSGSGSDLYRPSLPVVVRARVLNKKSPGSTVRKLTINAIATYCPFCGRQYSEA